MRPPVVLTRAAVRLAARGTTGPGVPFTTQRRRYDRAQSLAPLLRGTTIDRTSAAGVPVELVRAAGATTVLSAVHLHAGGYCIGSPRSHRAFAAALSAATGGTVCVPDYRLAPEHPYPAAPDDAMSVWNAVGGPEVSLSGDSAGAGLSVVLCRRLIAAGLPLPASLVLASPALDLSVDRGADAGLLAHEAVLTPDWLARCALAYADGLPLTNPEISPLLGDVAGLPPTLVVCGTHDLMLRDADRFSRHAREAGVSVTDLRAPGMWHVYAAAPSVLEPAEDAVLAMAAHIRAHAPR